MMPISSVPLAALLLGVVITPATAAPLAEIVLGSEPIRNEAIAAGNVRLVVTAYDPGDRTSENRPNLSYEIYVDGDRQAQVQEDVWWFGSLSLHHLDPDGVPEAVVDTFTGGAHCCSIMTIYSWRGDRLHQSRTYPLDAAAAGSFTDLDNDGYSELLSADPRFLYAFGSYAASWPPSIILSFRDGTWIDVTRQFPERLRSHAYRMYEYTRDSTLAQPLPGANSILAGYVAQKILLGEFQEGWTYMLYHFDPTDDWGLEHRNQQGDIIETYADYPTALAAFLEDLGYLDANGPNPDLDLSEVVIETESWR